MPILVHFVLVLVQALMASLAIVGKVVLRELPAPVLVSLRVLGAATALVAAGWLWGRERAGTRGDLARFALLGLLGVTLNQTLFLVGLRHTTAINATILVTTIPVFTVLESVLTGREPASPPKLAGIALAALGAIYLVGPDRVSLAPELALGNGLIVLGMLCYSTYLVLSKRMLERYRTLTVTRYAMLFGALGVLPLGGYAAASADFGAVSATTWLLTAYCVLFPTIVASFLNTWALKRVSSNLVAAYIYLQPILTVAVAPLLLAGETLTGRALVAGLAIFAGLALVIWAERLQQRELPGVEPMVGE
ncbi:MAG TPA: DMT family transporter [Gemmatimonadales bacterium]|nr:DMT family transporter [Gemmatimonadales bacterium]